MATEIIESLGCYASNEAKELLTELGLQVGLHREDAYRLIQLACFLVFPSNELKIPSSLTEADDIVKALCSNGGNKFKDITSIQSVIINARLQVCSELASDTKQVELFNEKLRQIFAVPDHADARKRWNDIFKPSHILSNEAFLFEQTFGAKLE